MPFNLIKLAEESGISVEYWNFEPPLQAVYIVDQGLPTPVIGLSEELFNNRALFRCVMAEELGHHFTTVGRCVSAAYFNYSDRLSVSKAEHKAIRWAAIHLMPYNRLIGAFKNGVLERWELAEYFDVTEEMVDFRLSLLKVSYEDALAKRMLKGR